jgi:hypothetical protein
MENKALKIYEELPSWAKGVVVVGGLAMGYILVSTIYKKFASIPDALDEQRKLNQLKEDLSEKLVTQDATYDDTMYNNLADEAENAFVNCRLDIVPCSTYLGIVCQTNSFREFRPVVEKLKSDVDFLKLQEAFGVRSISKQFWCGGAKDFNLPTLVRDQLNHYEISRLNTIMADNGVKKYEF